MNTLSKLNHSVTTMKSDIYFMCHCLLTVITPVREHSEVLNTSTAQQFLSVEGEKEVSWRTHTQFWWIEVKLLQCNRNSHLICFARLKQFCKHFSKLISPPPLHAWLSWCCTPLESWQKDTSGKTCCFGKLLLFTLKMCKIGRINHWLRCLIEL